MIPHAILIAITDLGDSGFTGAVALIAAAYLLLAGNRKIAGGLALSYVTAVCLITLAKIIAFRCSTLFAAWHIHSPSGHAALAASVYLMLASIIAEPLPEKRRCLVWGVAIPLVAAIAMTRILLGAHTVEEVVAGLAIGIGACWMSLSLAPHDRVVQFNWVKLAAALAVAAILFYGTHINAEAWLHQFVAHLDGRAGLCAI